MNFLKFLSTRNDFQKYIFTGIGNTLIHWSAFLFFTFSLFWGQGKANLVAFLIAVTFSFIINARWTFNKKVSVFRYVSFVLCMAFISGVVGAGGEAFNFNPFITLILFSSVSLILGYIASKYIIFRRNGV
ncbi:GtrA family protein [Enterobacter cloacae]